MDKHAWEYGDAEVAKVAVETLMEAACLSPLDRDVLYLRYGCGWLMDDIARFISDKYYNRKDDAPVVEGTVRYHLRQALKRTRAVLEPSITGCVAA